MSNAPNAKIQKVDLRLPDGLRDALNVYAATQGRSANAQIVFFIEQGMRGIDATTMAEAVLEIRQAIRDLQNKNS